MSLAQDRLRSYTGARHDLLAEVPPIVAGATVLDVGCSNGATGRLLQDEHGVSVIGIELDPNLAAEAGAHLERVVEGDALTSVRSLVAEGLEVDGVVFGDVLEHLVDPWACVDAVQELMPRGGWMVASIPNVAHYDTFLGLLRGTWPMRDRGIHDDTHLRFFARKDLAGLFNRGRVTIDATKRTYRLVERPHRINEYAHHVGWVWPNLFTFQFVVRANVVGS